MPHLVFGEGVDLEIISKKFSPIIVKSDDLIRIKDFYLNPAKNNALVSTLVIDEHHQDFFIEILKSDEKTTIRLYPLTDPKKTDSVKKAMVLVSQIILKEFPHLKITKTNLQDYIS